MCFEQDPELSLQLFPMFNIRLRRLAQIESFGRSNSSSGGEEMELWGKSRRRMMIGSTAPTCTYNECRGCKYKCRAEQVPVEGNDPINSAYHYKCVCHRERRGAQQQLLQNPPQIQNSKPAAAPN
ncbi:uncharacterized protein LOC127787360 isoform X3 [Diospyros lotus]|uniref:uncharacterized protein LOC127787360 isoform X3 n=1 Tax=Diospyros lotus TaxID=55363 RepID=UPI00224E5B4C|nr:uncharacterized protein LOC127787360 isoform X3 [Diospyros lotus]